MRLIEEKKKNTLLLRTSLLTKLLEIEKSHGRERKSAGGVYTGIAQARKMVRNGYVKGFPDLFIYEGGCRHSRA